MGRPRTLSKGIREKTNPTERILLEILVIKALQSSIDGLGARSRDSITSLSGARIQKVLRPDIGDSPANEEPSEGRHSLPAQRTLNAVRSLPYSARSRRSTHSRESGPDTPCSPLSRSVEFFRGLTTHAQRPPVLRDFVNMGQLALGRCKTADRPAGSRQQVNDAPAKK
jgi:hypothetical protein